MIITKRFLPAFIFGTRILPGKVLKSPMSIKMATISYQNFHSRPYSKWSINMKTLSIIIFGLLLSVNAFPQQVTIGSISERELFNDVKYDASGATISVGTIGTAGVGNGADCYLVKMNDASQILWQRTIVNPGNDALYRVRVCNNGDYLTCGRYFLNRQERGFVCRIDAATGNTLWSTTTANAASPAGDIFYDLIELSNGNIAVAGTLNFTPGAANSMIVLLNANGIEQWTRVGTFGNSDEVQTVNQLANGNLLACGHYWNGGSYNVMVIEMDQTGSLLGQIHYSINLSLPINGVINTLWPIQSKLIGGNIIYSMFGNTGTGTQNSVQLVYNYNTAIRAMSGIYCYHGSASPAYTAYPIADNDFIITQSNGANAIYVSRITNGVVAYDRQINNSTASAITGIDIKSNNLVLSGIAPVNAGDAYSLYSTINFPVTTTPCNISDVNVLEEGTNTPTIVPLAAWNTFALNATVAMSPLPTETIVASSAISICGVTRCPADTTVSLSKCVSQNLTLNARTGTSYSWAPATRLNAANVRDPICSAISAISYVCTITDSVTNCTYRDFVNVATYVQPPVNAGPDQTICAGAIAQLQARGAASYVWAPAATLSCSSCQGPQATPDATTTYQVTGTDAFGCSDSDKVVVTIIDKGPVSIEEGGAICTGDTIHLSATGGTSYLWMPAAGLNDPTVANPIAAPTETTTYQVIISQGSCFKDTLTTEVNVHQSPSVDLGADQNIVIGNTITLTPKGTDVAAYAWSPTCGLSCTDCANPVASPSKTTTYRVTVVSDFGCISSDELTVFVTCSNQPLWLPNTFTPNADGQNDRFYPHGHSVTMIKRFRIYDRWGELIYDITDIPVNDAIYGWDGTFKSQPLQPNVYIYVVNAVCLTGDEIELKGDVSLVR